jgi:hypothetical protein
MREKGGGGGGEKRGVLEVGDVEKACESARRMGGGAAMVMAVNEEGKEKRESCDWKVEGGEKGGYDGEEGKRRGGGGGGGGEKWDVMNSRVNFLTGGDEEVDVAMCDFDLHLDIIGTSPVHALDPWQSIRDSCTDIGCGAASLAPLTLKRGVLLPPIRTTGIDTPNKVMGGEMELEQSGFTPLFKRLKEELEGRDVGGMSMYLDGWGQEQQWERCLSMPNLDTRDEIGVNGSVVGDMMLANGSAVMNADRDRHAKLLAAQRATHEFNVRRLEMQGKKREYEDAVWRCEEARWRMEVLRGGGGWGLDIS